MKFKDIKIGTKVRLNRNFPREKIEEQVHEHFLPVDAQEYLQEARTVKGKFNNGKWKLVLLEDSDFYWPVELFEPVNTIKNKEEQVQEDIQKIKDIVKRYNLKNKAMGGLADTLIGWLEQCGA